jgi:hypothetical protein
MSISKNEKLFIMLNLIAVLGSKMKGDDGRYHTFWFARFLKPMNAALLIAGGILACVLPIQWGLEQADSLTPIGFIALIIFIPLSIYVYFEVRNIQNGFQEIFSKDNESLRGLFIREKEYVSFLRNSKKRIYSANEYYFTFIISIGIILPSGYIMDLAKGTTTLGFYLQALQKTPLLVTLTNAYITLYWTLVETILFSVVWLILGMTVALYNLGKEKANLDITRSNLELKKTIHEAKQKEISKLDLESADLSYGRLKCGLLPVADFVFTLALKIAVVGLFYSVPAMLYFIFSPLRYTGVVWYGLCSFSAVLSCMVFVIAQLGTYKVWNGSKDQTLVLLEQLCDKVKFECIRSMFSPQDFPSRERTERLEKDTNFIRSTIDDLRRLECTHFTVSSVAKLIGAVVLPFVPLIIYKLLGI